MEFEQLLEHTSISENGVPIEDQIESQSQETAAEKDESDRESTAFVGFARIFSGTVRRGAEVFVLGPKHDPQSFLAKVRAMKNSSHDEIISLSHVIQGVSLRH